MLAHAGVASRRECEKLIAAGRVSVDGVIVTEMGHKVDPERSDVRCDGTPIKPERAQYYLLNKPKGLVCTCSDEQGRPCVGDVFRKIPQRLYTVGRLDKDSGGLLIVTNDGALANRLTHPRHEIPKTYRVEIEGRIEPEELDQLKAGVWLAEGKAGAARVKVTRRSKKCTTLEIELREGRNRQIRRMLARTGHRVRKLTRIQVGPIRDSGLRVGKYRKLSPPEVQALRGSSGAPDAR